MKPALLSLAALLLCAAPGFAYEVVANGSFETPPLVSWQTFNQGSSGGQGSWYDHTSGNGTYSGLPTSAPPAGARQAVADNNGRAAAILYQDIVIPATTRATLSFVIWHGNAAPGGGYVNGSSLNPGSTNQRVRVDLINPATGHLITSSGVLLLLYQTGSGTPVIVNPTTIQADVTALAGQTVRLRAALVATTGPLIAGLDNVRLDVSPFSIHPAPLVGLYNSAARWGDFDNDGRMEIAMTGETGPSGETWIDRWNPANYWEHVYSDPGPYWGRSLAPVDAEGDGDLDLGVSGASGGTLAVLQNDGAAGFAASPQPVGASSGSTEWGDYDRDGDLDALITGVAAFEPWSGSTVSFIGRNDGSGGLTAIDWGLRGVFQGNAIWADLDRNGLLDIAQTGSLYTDIYYGDEAYGFMPYSNSLVDITTGQIAAGDLDNDGVEELVVTGHRNGNPPAAKVFRREPMFGFWVEISAGLEGVYSSSVALGDFDNDGWLDIALQGWSESSGYIARVYRNNMNLTFTDIGASLTVVSNGAMAFGDFEGDGDLDLLQQGSTPASQVVTQVLLNSTPTPNAAPSPPSVLYSQLAETELWLRFGVPGNDDHTPAATLTYNFRAGTAAGACNVVPPMSDLASGRRLVAAPGEARHTPYKRLLLNRIGHHHAVHWSAQSVDQSYRGSGWAPAQMALLGPTILQVNDVPNDQGGNVRLLIAKSPFDDENRYTYAATGYNVWRFIAPERAANIAREARAIDAKAANARLAKAGAQRPAGEPAAPGACGLPESDDLALMEWNGRIFARSPGRTTIGSPFPAGTWEIVASFFATQSMQYYVATTTHADSGATSANDKDYIVTVHTTTPSVWFASVPMGGHSVDNLAPGPPQGLAANYHTGSGNQLAWQPAPEADFESFRIYRGTTPDFVPSPANRVASVPAPAWTDPAYDSPVVFYKVSTTDHAGNESAAVSPGTTTAAGGGAPRLEFALREARPNPFAGATRIALALPEGGNVRLEVFDTSGRLVRTLMDGWLPAGEHEAIWGGDDRNGRRAPAGVYFYRVEAGASRAVRRVALLP